MDFQLFINNKQVLDGSFFGLILIIIIIIIALSIVILLVYKGARRNSRLKYEFITIVAHKFRTPLTYIKWVCDSLLSSETDPFKKKSFEDINKSNQKIIDLTSTLIEIADSESSGGVTYAFEKVPAGEFVKGIVAKFKDSFHEKNLFFGFQCEDDKSLIRVDRVRLDFVITTLLENARNYSPPGKNVDIIVKSNFLKVLIIVKDNGIGIPNSDIPHIFKKFFRGSNARTTDTEGLGVGLYLASSITKHFHGNIKAESAGVDQGSTFTITLPRYR